jgi:hypothetical protein
LIGHETRLKQVTKRLGIIDCIAVASSGDPSVTQLTEGHSAPKGQKEV